MQCIKSLHSFEVQNHENWGKSLSSFEYRSNRCTKTDKNMEAKHMHITIYNSKLIKLMSNFILFYICNVTYIQRWTNSWLFVKARLVTQGKNNMVSKDY